MDKLDAYSLRSICETLWRVEAEEVSCPDSEPSLEKHAITTFRDGGDLFQEGIPVGFNLRQEEDHTPCLH